VSEKEINFKSEKKYLKKAFGTPCLSTVKAEAHLLRTCHRSERKVRRGAKMLSAEKNPFVFLLRHQKLVGNVLLWCEKYFPLSEQKIALNKCKKIKIRFYVITKLRKRIK